MAGGGGSAEPGLRHERSRISGILLWSQLVEPLQELSVALHTVAHPCHPRPRAARAAHSRIEPSRVEWSLSCCHLFELIDRELEVVVHHLRADRSTNRRLIAAARTAKQCDTAELAAEPHAQCDVEITTLWKFPLKVIGSFRKASVAERRKPKATQHVNPAAHDLRFVQLLRQKRVVILL